MAFFYEHAGRDQNLVIKTTHKFARFIVDRLDLQWSMDKEQKKLQEDEMDTWISEFLYGPASGGKTDDPGK